MKSALWMLASSLLFAFYAAFIKLSSFSGISALEVLFYRSVLGVAVFWAMMRASHIVVATRHPVAHAVRSVIGTAAVLFGIYTIAHMNIGLAQTLTYTSPLFLGTFAVVMALFRSERLNFKLLASLVTGFAGVVVMLGPTISPAEYPYAAVGLASGMCVACAVSYVKKLGVLGEPTPRIIFYFVLTGAVAGFAGTMATGGFHTPDASAWLYIAGFMVCSNAAQFCLTTAFSSGNLLINGALQYTVVVFSTVLGIVMFGDEVTLAVVTGMALVVASSIAAGYFGRKKK